MEEFVGMKCWVCSCYKSAPPGYLEDWSDLYEISREGKVRDKKTGELLKEYHNDNREQVKLVRDGKERYRFIYRCVATTFPECGEYGEKYQVDHINSNPHDNRAENLRWVKDQKENMHNPATQAKIKESRERNKQRIREFVWGK